MKRYLAALVLVAIAAGFAIAGNTADAPCPLPTSETNTSSTSPEKAPTKYVVQHNTGKKQYVTLCLSAQGAYAHYQQHQGDIITGATCTN